jgi:hypothetical protein
MVERKHISSSEKELIEAVKQVDAFDESIKEMTMDRMNAAPKEEAEPQTQIAQIDRDKLKDIYLKPVKSIGCREKFNEKWRKQYEFDREYVQFEAENKEIIGEAIELWTRPYPGMAAEFWIVPVNKPVWGHRHLAEQIKRASYHRLVMKENIVVGGDHAGQYFGSMAADTTVQRLDARPVSSRKSVFMGNHRF